jgi:hypothetical protein
MCSIGGLSLIVHVNAFGLFRYEYINYTIDKYPEDLRTLKEQNQALNTARNSNMSLYQKLLITFNYIQVAPIELLTRIVFPKGYRGYKRWYIVDGIADAEAKKLFRKNYRYCNQRLLQGFGTISMLSNLSVFVIAAFLGHLEWAVYTIVFGFNAVFIVLVVLQRMSFKKQLAIAGIRTQSHVDREDK